MAVYLLSYRAGMCVCTVHPPICVATAFGWVACGPEQKLCCLQSTDSQTEWTGLKASKWGYSKREPRPSAGESRGANSAVFISCPWSRPLTGHQEDGGKISLQLVFRLCESSRWILGNTEEHKPALPANIWTTGTTEIASWGLWHLTLW